MNQYVLIVEDTGQMIGIARASYPRDMQSKDALRLARATGSRVTVSCLLYTEECEYQSPSWADDGSRIYTLCRRDACWQARIESVQYPPAKGAVWSSKSSRTVSGADLQVRVKTCCVVFDLKAKREEREKVIAGMLKASGKSKRAIPAWKPLGAARTVKQREAILARITKNDDLVCIGSNDRELVAA